MIASSDQDDQFLQTGTLIHTSSLPIELTTEKGQLDCLWTSYQSVFSRI